MVPIPLCDLDAQHQPLRVELEAAFQRVLRSSRFVLGPEVEAFEREVAAAIGVDHAVGVSSGTDALLAMLMALGLGPGDEVVTTPFSFFATVEAILRVGARPVFADIEAETFNLDPDQAASGLGPRTKAILVVHLFGQPAHTGALGATARGAGIPLLEDAAQAIGARALHPAGTPPVGALGLAAALSFHPSKNLGGLGDGGMVLTSDRSFAERVRMLRAHGSREKFLHAAVGGNFRLDELQAALLRVKLPHLAVWNTERRRIAGLYLEELAELPLRLPATDAGGVWHQFVVRVPDGRRDLLARHLQDRGVATAVYYPVPLHLQPALAALGGRPGQFPRAEQAARETLALPIHPELSADRLRHVCESVRSFFTGAR